MARPGSEGLRRASRRKLVVGVLLFLPAPLDPRGNDSGGRGCVQSSDGHNIERVGSDYLWALDRGFAYGKFNGLVLRRRATAVGGASIMSERWHVLIAVSGLLFQAAAIAFMHVVARTVYANP